MFRLRRETDVKLVSEAEDSLGIRWQMHQTLCKFICKSMHMEKTGKLCTRHCWTLRCGFHLTCDCAHVNKLVDHTLSTPIFYLTWLLKRPYFVRFLKLFNQPVEQLMILNKKWLRQQKNSDKKNFTDCEMEILICEIGGACCLVWNAELFRIK